MDQAGAFQIPVSFPFITEPHHRLEVFAALTSAGDGISALPEVKPDVNYSLLEAHSSASFSCASALALQSIRSPFEHESRTLFVRNLPYKISDEKILSRFSLFGDIRSLFSHNKFRGFVMISYFDIRHATQALRHLQGATLSRRKISIHYARPKNNTKARGHHSGTLVVFDIDQSTPNPELHEIFRRYGEIKEIRETPSKSHQRFIEFYDVRHAQEAAHHLNNTIFRSRIIKVMPFRPRGTRKSCTPG